MDPPARRPQSSSNNQVRAPLDEHTRDCNHLLKLITNNHLDAFQALVKAKPELLSLSIPLYVKQNQVYTWATVLGVVVVFNRPSFVDFLLSQRDYNLNWFCFQDGLDALQRAVICGHLEVVDLLLKHRKPSDAEPNTAFYLNHCYKYENAPLGFAVCALNIKMVQLLFKHGVSLKDNKHAAMLLFECMQQCKCKNECKRSGKQGCACIQECLDLASLLLNSIEDKQAVFAQELGDFPFLYHVFLGKSTHFREWLIKYNPDLNTTDKHGSTLLMMAVSNGRPDLVNWLLDSKRKVDVNIRDSNGYSALMCAVTYGTEEMITSLINAKADLDPALSLSAIASDEPNPIHEIGMTPLMMATVKGSDRMVALLIDALNNQGLLAGAMAKKTLAGKNALSFAQAYRAHGQQYINIIKLFLKQYDVHTLSLHDKQACINDLLIEYYHSKSQAQKSNVQDLFYKLTHKNVNDWLSEQVIVTMKEQAGGTNCIKQLVEHIQLYYDNKLYLLDAIKPNGRPILTFIAQYGNINKYNYLLSVYPRLNIDEVDASNRTSLSYAAEYGEWSIFSKLIQTKKIAIHHMDYAKKSILDYALDNFSTHNDPMALGKQCIVNTLLDKRVDVTQLSNPAYEQLLAFVIAQKSRINRLPKLSVYDRLRNAIDHPTHLLHILSALDADDKANYLTQTDADDRTLLSHAAEKGQLALVKVLMPYNRNQLNKIDQHGKTPLWYAVKEMYVEVAQYLTSQGADVQALLSHNDDALLLVQMIQSGKEHVAMIQWLLDHGYSIPYCSSGKGALYHAVEKNDTRAVALLLSTMRTNTKYHLEIYEAICLAKTLDNKELYITLVEGIVAELENKQAEWIVLKSSRSKRMDLSNILFNNTPIVYTAHAEQRIQERNITKETIVKILKAPQEKSISNHLKHIFLFRIDRTCVVVTRYQNQPLVITVYQKK